MYADDSIMCCLFPNKCNMFPQTPVVIFSETMEYLNMMIVISSPIFIIWSIVQIVLKFMESKKTKLIERKDSKKSYLQKLMKEEEIECMDDHSSDKNNYDRDENRDRSETYSDSNLSIPHMKQLQKSCILDQSNSDCFLSELSFSGHINKDTNNTRRTSSISSKQCWSISKDEVEEKNHYLNQHEYEFGCVVSNRASEFLTIIPEKPFMQVVQDNTNTGQLNDTVNINIR